jgi:hypothetical protein
MFVTMILSAGGSSEKNGYAKQTSSIVQVTGVVRLVGSSPFSEFVIRGSEYQWYIAKEDAEMFRTLQHQTVTVEGEETVIELQFAGGQPAGSRRELRNVKIISIY